MIVPSATLDHLVSLAQQPMRPSTPEEVPGAEVCCQGLLCTRRGVCGPAPGQLHPAERDDGAGPLDRVPPRDPGEFDRSHRMGFRRQEIARRQFYEEELGIFNGESLHLEGTAD